MEQGMITCPNCGQEFELSDALTGRIREHLKVELLREVSRREAELKKRNAALKAQEAQISKSREAIDARNRIPPERASGRSRKQGRQKARRSSMRRSSRSLQQKPRGKRCGHQELQRTGAGIAQKTAQTRGGPGGIRAGSGPQTGCRSGKRSAARR